VKAAQPGPGYRCRRSCLAWQATQRAASGRASSRPSGISSPQSTHRPYVFSSMRRSAASTSSRWLRAEWRIASVRSASERWDPASAGSCGYPAPAIGAGRSPCRMDIDRSRSSRISSRRLRATVMSTSVLASRPRAIRSPGSGEPRPRAADSEQLAGRPVLVGGCRTGAAARRGKRRDELGPVVPHGVDSH